jgi:transcriptional regulator with XRE-family HTH domain
MEDLGSRMRKLREDRGLSLVFVAEVMGISDSALSQIEKGHSKNAKLEGFLKFCAYFDEDPYYLVFGQSRASVTGTFRKLESRET